MNCPYCEFSGHRMDVHAHLVNEHPDKIEIYVDEPSGKMAYQLTCPICNEVAKKLLRKPAAVLQEYQREIRMVAFDLLLYHIQELHEIEPGS